MSEQMQYRLLGKSGLRVSEMALGTMSFGEDWGWGADETESRRMFDMFAERGGNFLDTAVNYTAGSSEKMLGKFIASDRDHFVLGTKYSLSTRPGDPNFSGNHRKNMMRSVEDSLKRLGTDHIDLLWLHAWDNMTPVEEVLRGMDDLVRQGKVHYLGISDTPAWIVSRANTMAELRGWARFVGLQIRYSLIDRTAERDLLPMAEALDLAVTPWSVLGAGVLTGKYNNKEKVSGRAAKGAATKQRNLDIAQAVIEVAEESGCNPSHVAIRWAMQRPGVVIPLIGANNTNQLDDNLGALDIELSSDQIGKLNEASAFDIGFPHNFLAEEGIRKIIYGGTHERLRSHRRYTS